MFEPVDTEAVGYIWHQIARQILALVRDGTLPPGRRLLTEPELADEFKVARLTVRRALEWLRDKGVALSYPGRGTFIAPTLPDPLPEPPDGFGWPTPLPDPLPTPPDGLPL